ncbi:MAG: hypothetical protein B7Y25_06290 [Alphaproteobacteria bacterium 16-39-46]|nr:MAG: hypothetical protein B7Y25_06290 [Alphaproteobacteria bacterium 16-39-46]OZA42337.1 MAG: hypothetical protein B7X84_06380 [Alphaproteobacteria bacterium 17-39-52]HQS83866.1 YggT family protein [Alphaproteobacteria bacterium]HQS93545.1 YggT family protein [Alphaproteobacteria bacterium]
MDIILIPLIQLIDYGLRLYIWAIIIYTLLNMCISFQMVNPYNQFIKISEQFLSRIIDPILNRIRRIVPFFGSVDLSPLILIFTIYLIQGILNQILIRL